jgi:drug/metabolite transporter (DMT)-like permease
MEKIPYVGEILALLSPLAWSFAVILYRKTGETVPAVALNLFKNVLATLLFGGSLLLLGQTAPEGVDGGHYGLLLLSGAIGIAGSDLLFFMCLNRIGAGRQAVVNTGYSPSIILLSFFFLGERLTAFQILGVALILCAVVTVGFTRERGGERGGRVLLAGVLFGVGACVSQAVSIVIIKPYMSEWPVMWMTTWRMVGGLAATILMLPAVPRAQRGLAALRKRKAWPVMVSATIIGTYVSLLLWMGGFKYTQASVAAALNQTATLFTFLLAVILLHEPVTRRRLLGLLLGVAGVALVTFLGHGG